MKVILLFVLVIELASCLPPRRATACQITEAVILQDAPSHLPPPEQQYTIQAEEVLPVIERVWIPQLGAVYVKVRYGLVEGYVPLADCRMVTR